MWKLKDPATGLIGTITPQWDEESQTDLALEKAKAKGYEQVEVVVNPNGAYGTVKPENLEKAFQKGYKTPEQDKIVASGPEEVDDWVSATLGASQGLTMGFADEMAAGLDATIKSFQGQNFKAAYENSLAVQRNLLERAEKDDKGIVLASEVVASLIVPFAGAKALKGSSGIAAEVAKGGSTLMAATAIGAGQGAVEAYGRSENKTDLKALQDTIEGSLWGGLATFGIGALGKGISHAYSKLAKESTEDIVETIANTRPKIAVEAVKETDKAMSNILKEFDSDLEQAREVIRNADFDQLMNNPNITDIKNTIMKGGDKEQVARKWNSLTPDKKEEVVTSYAYEKGLTEAYSKEAARVNKEIGASLPDVGNGVWNQFIAEPGFVFRELDDALGTDLEAVALDMATQGHKVTNLTTKHMEGIRLDKSIKEWTKRPKNVEELEDGIMYPIESLWDITKSTKYSENDIGKFLDGNKPTPDDVRPLVNAMRTHFDETTIHAKSEGMIVDYMENYFPMVVKDAPNVYIGLKASRIKFSKLIDDLGSDIKTFADRIEEPETWKLLDIDQDMAIELSREWKDTLAMTKRINGTAAENFDHIDTAIQSTLKDRYKKTTGFEMGILQKREGELGETYREWNPFTAFMQYSNSVYKGIHLNPSLSKLQLHAENMKKVGAPKSAEYIDKLVSHLSGSISDPWFGVVNKLKADFRTTVADPESPITKRALAKTGQAALDLYANMTGIAYGSLLGGSVSTATKNVGSAILTAPHVVGGTYGHKVMMRGLKSIRASKELVEKETKGAFNGNNALAKFLKDKDLYSEADRMKEIEGLMEFGSETNIGHTGTARFFKNMSRSLMHFFIEGEKNMVTMVYGMGQEVAKDFAAKRPAAIKAISELPSGIRNHIDANNIQGEQLGDLLGRYYRDQVMLNYGKEHMSRAAREVGPWLRMFTKWPLSQSSKLMYATSNLKGPERKAALRSMKSLTIPFALSVLADHVWEASVEEGSTADRTKRYVVGKKFSDMAPLKSVTELRGGPMVQLTMGNALTISKYFTGEKDIENLPKDIGKASYNALMTVGPAAPLQAVFKEADKMSKAFNDQSIWETLEDDFR